MTSRNGLQLSLRRVGTKSWFYATTPPDGSAIAFRDLFDMIRLLIPLEITKYGGNPAKEEDWERWSAMPYGFLRDCCLFASIEYEPLRKKWDLPR